jgi:hypothetical protein
MKKEFIGVIPGWLGRAPCLGQRDEPCFAVLKSFVIRLCLVITFFQYFVILPFVCCPSVLPVLFSICRQMVRALKLACSTLRPGCSLPGSHIVVFPALSQLDQPDHVSHQSYFVIELTCASSNRKSQYVVPAISAAFLIVTYCILE